MVLNIYNKQQTGNGRDLWFIKIKGELDFSSFLYQTIKELTTWEWYAVSDMNHCSHQQLFYGSLRPTVNTDQSVTQSSVDKIKYYTVSITK